MSMMAFSRQILDLDRQSINAVDPSRGGALESDRSDAPIGRLTTIRRAIVAGASGFCARFLAALHDSRRNRAAVEIARFRDLIPDPDSGTDFGVNPAARPDGRPDSDLPGQRSHAARSSVLSFQSGDRTARD